jgi:hypothetical protein
LSIPPPLPITSMTGARPPTNLKEVTMKARYYRIFGSLTALSVLAAILAAPKKWG